jgi:hypothetical protein
MNLTYLKHLNRSDLCKKLFYRKNTETNETVIINFDNYMGNVSIVPGCDRLLCIDGKQYNADIGECLQTGSSLVIVMEATSRFIK